MFEIREDFYWKEKPLKIISGALHYFRVVPDYWEDRLTKLKAMGCNTVETYVPWNFHEEKEGIFDFNGHKDLNRFIRLAGKLNLFVILRPSPYICAEWELGGLPSWLLKDKNMKLRLSYGPYLEKVRFYYNKLFKEVVELQYTYGGPILMMQVENEYGSYGSDKDYLNDLVEMMKENGVDVPLVTSDGSWFDMLENGTIKEKALPTVNFGSKTNEHFDILEIFSKKNIPLMVMEFWNGWFNAWGDDSYKETDKTAQAEELREILDRGHVNFYMFHGGTNFGFNNGSNYYERLSPDITSYDYDAPLSEWGDVTEKYKLFREVIKEKTRTELPELTQPVEKKAYGKVERKKHTSLFGNLDNISAPLESSYTQSMEDLDQHTGYILYRNDLGKKRPINSMRLIGAGDRAKVYVNEEHLFTQYDSELGREESFELTDETNTLDILVENMGRVNYGPKLSQQRKGIDQGVFVNASFRSGWTHYSLPLDNLERLDYDKPVRESEPSFSQFTFTVDECQDTFVDTAGWGKGCVFINGFNLGRFWEIGPQYLLYLPGPLLVEGENELVIFETEGKAQNHINLTDKPPYQR